MLDRRKLLQGLAVSALSAAMPIRLSGANATATALIVLVARTTRSRGPVLADALAALRARGIAAGVALPAGATLPAEALGDVLYWSPAPLPDAPYFQARRLSQAHSALAASLPPGTHLDALCAPDPGGEIDMRGLRVAGFRAAIMVPEDSAPTSVATHHGQTVVTRGGHWVAPGGATALRAYLDATIADPERVHAALFVDLDRPPDSARGLVAEIAGVVAEAMERGVLTPLAPHELGVRHFSYFERLVGVLVDAGEAGTSPAARRAISAMRASLTQAGIAHSASVAGPVALAPGECLKLGPEAGDPPGGLPRGLICAVSEGADAARLSALAEAGTAAVLSPGAPGFAGLDGNGLFRPRMPERVTGWQQIEAIAARLSLVEEPVIVLDATAFATPAQRNAASAALGRLAALPGTRVSDLATYAERLVNPDPVFQTQRATRIAAPRIAPAPEAAIGAEARAALMDDARRAFRYFTRLDAPASGMPAASCQFDAEGTPVSTYDVLTQWDVGSVIFGYLAAEALGLIGPEAFAAWRDRALATLHAATLPEPRLPCGAFPIAAPSRRSPSFNARDVGRLLSALSALDRRAPEGDSAVRDLVAGWDLRAILVGGVPHSVENGRLQAEPDSHSSSYLARAFRYWGLGARSAYSVYDLGETTTDHRMHLLYKAADIGNFGAEPLLLEALELGWTTPLRTLSDVLFAAQLEEFTTTGRVFAPSEASREEAPWFTYQGLRVDRSGEARWDVMVPGGGAAYRTPEFRARTRMVASKAAYLWAAARPHPFSGYLVDYVRRHATLPVGFAAGIYTEGDRPTRHYGDVNTNGIILQAIAAMLAPGR